ncbi:uncharacterized protein LOC135091576 isoform X1 [Scylla paramamosain]|uniref:uncharacterized protein LOC135091576 isoform X1 n=1 Tax=Scylla paramamosain TaxID=85552 RepID=UPI0030831B37
MLIVPKVRVPFDSLAELVDQTEVPWTMAHGSIVQSFFSSAYDEAPTSTMGRGWKGRSPLLRSATDIIPTVIGGTAGLYTRHSSTYLMGKDFSENGYCRLALTRGGYMAVQHSMGFPLGSSLKPVLDELVYRMMEFGLVEKFIAKEMANTSYCLMPPGREGYTELRPLALGDFLGVLSLYGAGVVGSMGMFVAEVMRR